MRGQCASSTGQCALRSGSYNPRSTMIPKAEFTEQLSSVGFHFQAEPGEGDHQPLGGLGDARRVARAVLSAEQVPVQQLAARLNIQSPGDGTTGPGRIPRLGKPDRQGVRDIHDGGDHLLPDILRPYVTVRPGARERLPPHQLQGTPAGQRSRGPPPPPRPRPGPAGPAPRRHPSHSEPRPTACTACPPPARARSCGRRRRGRARPAAATCSTRGSPPPTAPRPAHRPADLLGRASGIEPEVSGQLRQQIPLPGLDISDIPPADPDRAQHPDLRGIRVPAGNGGTIRSARRGDCRPVTGSGLSRPRHAHVQAIYSERGHGGSHRLR